VEYRLPGINQVQVHAKAGMTFAAALRSILRCDPDVVLLGEIRDAETAQIAVEAALTGHLVLSTLHTNDAASAINRLLDIGVNAGILASALSLVVAQRLVRLLCPKCALRQPTPPDVLKLFQDKGIPAPAETAHAAGCDNCYNSGYRGRSGVYEVIQIDRAIASLIFSGALNEDIQDAAVKAGTHLMFKQALKKVAQHLTSIEEVSRVIADYE
jgi:type IV pilus assembly protein PilB